MKKDAEARYKFRNFECQEGNVATREGHSDNVTLIKHKMREREAQKQK